MRLNSSNSSNNRRRMLHDDRMTFFCRSSRQSSEARGRLSLSKRQKPAFADDSEEVRRLQSPALTWPSPEVLAKHTDNDRMILRQWW